MTNDIKHQNESNLETMAKMPDNLIDLTVTSPPYDNLRTCEKDSLTCGEFEDIVKELWRITKDGGVKKAWEEKIKEKEITSPSNVNLEKEETGEIEMTKQDAIEAMKAGAKLTHQSFMQHEWITMEGNRTIITEKGYAIRDKEFWAYRTGEYFETGWFIWGAS